MLKLRTLGSIGLEDGSAGRTFSVVAHPKRFALLTYLVASSPGGFLRRDTLLATFWPDLGEQRARRALNQALYAIRQDLGEAVVISRGQDEVGVNVHALWSDVVAFREAMEAGSWQEAVDLYGGDLLPGFHLSESSAFDDWLERERLRLRRDAAEAAQAAAEACAEEGRWEDATGLAARAAEYLGEDETALRHLIAFLDGLGDRAGAIATYEAFARRLRDEYEVEPAPETVAMMEAIRARNQARVVPVGAGWPGLRRSWRAADSGQNQTTGGPAGPPGRRDVSMMRRRVLPRIAVAATLAAVIVVTFVTRQRGAAMERLQSFTVLPFKVTADGDGLQWLSSGAQMMLSSSLDAWSETTVVDSRRLAAAAEERGTSIGPDITLAEALSVSRALDAGTVVAGEVVGHEDGMEITVRLYDVKSGRALGDPIRVRGGPDGDVRTHLDAVAAAILRLGSPSAPAPDLAAATTTSLVAYRHYLTGMGAMRAWELDHAIEEFESAVAADSTFALALFRLAQTGYYRSERNEPDLMDQAVRHSARLNSDDLLHLMAYKARVDLDFDLARDRYRDILAADSLDASAWYHLADVEFWDEMTVYGENGELKPRSNLNVALDGYLRAVDADPTFLRGYGEALLIQSSLGGTGYTPFVRPEEFTAWHNLESVENVVYFYSAYRDSIFWVRVEPHLEAEIYREYASESVQALMTQRAITLARRWVNANPASTEARIELVELYWKANEPALALESWKDFLGPRPDTTIGHRSLLGQLYLGAGVYDTAAAVLDQAVELFRGLEDAPATVPPDVAPNVFVATGRPSHAVHVFPAWYDDVGPMYKWIPTDDGGIDYSDSWALIAKALVLGSGGVRGPRLQATLSAMTEQWTERHPANDLPLLYQSHTARLAGGLLAVEDEYLQAWLQHLPDSMTPSAAASSQPAAWRALLLARAGERSAADVAFDSALAVRDEWPEASNAGNSYLMGFVAQELGRDAVAIGLFGDVGRRRRNFRMDRMTGYWGLLSLSYLHRARSFERIGETARALEDYRRFQRAWADSEPDVRHYLEDAEAGIRRLTLIRHSGG